VLNDLAFGHGIGYPQPIEIGQVASRSGGNPGGLDNIAGAELAVEEINRCGGLLDGRPLVLVVEDDRTEPGHAVTAFSDLARRDVCAVVGTSFSNASLAVIPYAERAGLTYVSTGGAQSQVDPVRPHIFMTPPSSSVVAEQITRFIAAQGWTVMAVAHDTKSSFSLSGARAMRPYADAQGIELLCAGTFETKTADFAAIFRSAGASGAQALVAWATGPPSLAIVRHYQTAGVGLPLLLSHGAATRELLAAVTPPASNIYVATSLAMVGPDLPCCAVRDAAAKMTSLYLSRHARLPSQYVADGYTAVWLIAEAIRAGNSSRRHDIAESLTRLTSPTPQGVYRMTPENHHGLLVHDVAITRPRGGRYIATGWSRNQFTTHLCGCQL
jgi:branched-chain amino acid transport system substrate-binding protein